jgi:hypothetical protein
MKPAYFLQVSLCALVGFIHCGFPVTSRHALRPDSSDAPLVKEFAYSCQEGLVGLEYTAKASYHIGFWVEKLRVAVKNKTPDTLLFDWTTSRMVFNDTLVFAPQEARTREKRYFHQWIEIPPKESANLNIWFVGGEEFLEVYNELEHLRFTTGFVRALDSTIICAGPDIYASIDPEGNKFIH